MLHDSARTRTRGRARVHVHVTRTRARAALESHVTPRHGRIPSYRRRHAFTVAQLVLYNTRVALEVVSLPSIAARQRGARANATSALQSVGAGAVRAALCAIDSGTRTGMWRARSRVQLAHFRRAASAPHAGAADGCAVAQQHQLSWTASIVYSVWLTGAEPAHMATQVDRIVVTIKVAPGRTPSATTLSAGLLSTPLAADDFPRRHA